MFHYTVEINSVFVMDVTSLQNVKDIYCDDMGSWKSNETYSTVIEVDADGDVTTVVLDDKKIHSQSVCTR